MTNIKKEFICFNHRKPKAIIDSFYPLHKIIDFLVKQIKNSIIYWQKQR